MNRSVLGIVLLGLICTTFVVAADPSEVNKLDDKEINTTNGQRDATQAETKDTGGATETSPAKTFILKKLVPFQTQDQDASNDYSFIIRGAWAEIHDGLGVLGPELGACGPTLITVRHSVQDIKNIQNPDSWTAMVEGNQWRKPSSSGGSGWVNRQIDGWAIDYETGLSVEILVDNQANWPTNSKLIVGCEHLMLAIGHPTAAAAGDNVYTWSFEHNGAAAGTWKNQQLNANKSSGITFDAPDGITAAGQWGEVKVEYENKELGLTAETSEQLRITSIVQSQLTAVVVSENKNGETLTSIDWIGGGSITFVHVGHVWDVLDQNGEKIDESDRDDETKLIASKEGDWSAGKADIQNHLNNNVIVDADWHVSGDLQDEGEIDEEVSMYIPKQLILNAKHAIWAARNNPNGFLLGILDDGMVVSAAVGDSDANPKQGHEIEVGTVNIEVRAVNIQGDDTNGANQFDVQVTYSPTGS